MQAAAQVTADPDDSGPLSISQDHQALISNIAQTQDRDAFKTLFLYFGPRIKALMLKAGASHDQSEDIVQDVMITVWHKVHLYAPERGSVSTWIFTIARNARIDRLRRRSSQAYQDIEELNLISSDPNGEDEAIATQRVEKVAQALTELPDEQRQIIELAYIHDLPQSEIASKLALPLGTVKSRMRLAYAKLKDKLEELK